MKGGRSMGTSDENQKLVGIYLYNFDEIGISKKIKQLKCYTCDPVNPNSNSRPRL